MLYYKGHLYRPTTRTAARMNMYHGTATGDNNARARKIMKMGLIADPQQKEKPYGGLAEDEDDYGLDPDVRDVVQFDESFGGTYVTNRIGEALRYAKNAAQTVGGDPMLLSLSVETRTPGTAIDEDLLFGKAADYIRFNEDPTESALDSFLWAVGSDEAAQIADWTAIANNYIKHVLPNLRVHQERLKSILPIMASALMNLYIVDLLHDSGHEIKEELWDMDIIGEDLDPTEFIAAYQEYGREVTEKFKEATQPAQGLHNIRLTQTIGYRGANRILAAVSWSPDRRGVVWYAKDRDAANELVRAVSADNWFRPDGTPITPKGR